MTPQILLTLAIIMAAVVLFATEKLRVDVVALLVLLALVLTGLVSVQEAFAGFANPAVVTVWAVYIVSGGLFKTGVADILGRRIIRLAGPSEPRLIGIIMLACGVMSAFMNNIGATAVLLPAVVGISRQARVPLSRLLIPLSFSSLLGGNMTMIGTPPNVLATSILAERGIPSFGFFDFTPMGLIVFGTGILYMVSIGRRLLPVRESLDVQEATSRLREYISEVRVSPDSPLVGKTLAESNLGSEYDLTVLAVIHDDRVIAPPRPETRFQPHDLIMIAGGVENLLRVRRRLKLTIEAERVMGLEEMDSDRSCIVEATLSPRSRLTGRTLREIRFRDRYGFTALAIWRHGEAILQRLRDVRLRFGDTLLLQGPRRRLPVLQESNEFLVLEPVALTSQRPGKAPISIGIMGLVLALTSLAGFHVSLAMVIGAVLMVLTGCLTMDEGYESIEWRSVFLIAGMLPLGTAMEATGTARFLADLLIEGLRSLGPIGLLMGVYVLAALSTEVMSNAAATVLIVPIAIDIALGIGASPHPFALATVIGASTSFLTPVGHQANVLVFGPGGYRFFDYTRVGLPLNLVILLVSMIFLPILWPLF